MTSFGVPQYNQVKRIVINVFHSIRLKFTGLTIADSQQCSIILESPVNICLYERFGSNKDRWSLPFLTVMTYFKKKAPYKNIGKYPDLKGKIYNFFFTTL